MWLSQPHYTRNYDLSSALQQNIWLLLDSVYWYLHSKIILHTVKVCTSTADTVSTLPGCWQVLSPTRKETSDVCDFNNIETRAVIKFPFLQGKVPKETHTILTEILASFLPGRAKDLSASLYYQCHLVMTPSPHCNNERWHSKHARLTAWIYKSEYKSPGTRQWPVTHFRLNGERVSFPLTAGWTLELVRMWW